MTQNPTAPQSGEEVLHKLMFQPSHAVIYPETEMENGYPIAKRILESYVSKQEVEKLIREARLDELAKLEKTRWTDIAYDMSGYIIRRISELKKGEIE